jgi:hypothetical protein
VRVLRRPRPEVLRHSGSQQLLPGREDNPRTIPLAPGEREKLDQIEQRWPKADRVHLQAEAEIAVEALGSDEMRSIIAAVRKDELGTIEDRWQAFYDRFVEQARRELGSDPPWLTTSTHPPEHSASSPA